VRYRGAFAWQTNNSTREFEYPWAYEQVAAIGSPLTVVDVGGGLAGLQFVLAREGHRVVNVDPGMSASGRGFELDPVVHADMARWLRAPVQLVPRPIQDADLAPGSVDVVLSVSAIEHFSPGDLRALSQEAGRILKPRGYLVMTVDLFLDLHPFTSKADNEFGVNVDIAAFLAGGGFDLVSGTPAELSGYPDFDSDRILRELPQFLIGRGWPTLTQLVVARLGDT
jgi:SAM-dependent methyltransferase